MLFSVVRLDGIEGRKHATQSRGCVCRDRFVRVFNLTAHGFNVLFRLPVTARVPPAD